jgi:hypothetical protein
MYVFFDGLFGVFSTVELIDFVGHNVMLRTRADEFHGYAVILRYRLDAVCGAAGCGLAVAFCGMSCGMLLRCFQDTATGAHIHDIPRTAHRNVKTHGQAMDS